MELWVEVLPKPAMVWEQLIKLGKKVAREVWTLLKKIASHEDKTKNPEKRIQKMGRGRSPLSPVVGSLPRDCCTATLMS